MCMVIPMDRRSLTRMTLLMTSRPRSSKTNTFQMGFPSASSIGATGARRPLAWASSASLDSTVSLRLRIFFRDARMNVEFAIVLPCQIYLTYLTISQRVTLGSHGCWTACSPSSSTAGGSASQTIAAPQQEQFGIPGSNRRPAEIVTSGPELGRQKDSWLRLSVLKLGPRHHQLDIPLSKLPTPVSGHSASRLRARTDSAADAGWAFGLAESLRRLRLACGGGQSGAAGNGLAA